MQLRYVLGGGLVIAAMMAISIITYFQNQEAYFSIDELLADPGLYAAAPAAGLDAALGAPVGRRMQLRGIVEADSVRRPDTGLELRFELSGKTGAVPVVYEGIVPDTFERADTVTVGGYLTDSGVFKAEDLFVQCPSKYEAVPPGEQPASETGPEARADG
ncbi:MAG: cytochrome c maturation protein CcmE [Chloroflexi bacterium]|nr:cytochrome c maturation protein CcmE [Chloroflexota bacterium]